MHISKTSTDDRILEVVRHVLVSVGSGSKERESRRGGIERETSHGGKGSVRGRRDGSEGGRVDALRFADCSPALGGVGDGFLFQELVKMTVTCLHFVQGMVGKETLSDGMAHLSNIFLLIY